MKKNGKFGVIDVHGKIVVSHFYKRTSSRAGIKRILESDHAGK